MYIIFKKNNYISCRIIFLVFAKLEKVISNNSKGKIKSDKSGLTIKEYQVTFPDLICSRKLFDTVAKLINIYQTSWWKKTCCRTWPNLRLRTCNNSRKTELQVGQSPAKFCKVVFSLIRKSDAYINFVIVSNLYSVSHSTHFDMCMMNNRILFVFSNTT